MVLGLGRRERWSPRHHVVESRTNGRTPKGIRAYFDALPSVGVKEREFYGLVDAPYPKPQKASRFGVVLQGQGKDYQSSNSGTPSPEPACDRYTADASQGEGGDGEGSRAESPLAGSPKPDINSLMEAIGLRRRAAKAAPTLAAIAALAGPGGGGKWPSGSRGGSLSSTRGSMTPSGSARRTESPETPAEDPKLSRGGTGKFRDLSKKVVDSTKLSSNGREGMSAPAFQKGDGFLGVTEFKVFMEWVVKKHKDLVCLWYKLDQDRSMIITHSEFFRGMKELSYKGNLETLWKLIDRDTTGNISFLEFAPEAALQLTRFKKWATDNFGTATNLFLALDADRSGSVTLKEFTQGCKAKGLPANEQEGMRTLFRLMDNDAAGVRGAGSIDKEEILFLDKWQPPPYLLAEADVGARERLFNALLARHNDNSFMAWRRALDKDSSMRVSYEEFVIQCQALLRSGMREASPPCGIPAMYAAIDQARSGWFTFKDWDSQTHSWLLAWVKYCRTECGSCTKFLQRCIAECNADIKNDIGVDFKTFSKSLNKAEIGLAPSQRLAVFEGLQAPTKRGQSDGGRLTSADLIFLQTWDPDQEERDENLWESLLQNNPIETKEEDKD
mmetsp:Transcript_163183/g.523373  ORF Transcript_163183/g.523373 Transcript_163183/m.523373 type:complete len:614 (-) Transcript_163183:326-2167(-)